MTWTYFFQLLCDPFSPSRFTREEVMGLSWHYIREVLFCERDKERNPVVPRSPEHKIKTYPEQLREIYWNRGYPEHIIKKKVAEVLERNAQALKMRLMTLPRDIPTKNGETK